MTHPDLLYTIWKLERQDLGAKLAGYRIAQECSRQRGAGRKEAGERIAVISIHCVSFFRPAGRKNDTQFGTEAIYCTGQVGSWLDISYCVRSSGVRSRVSNVQIAPMASW